METTKLCWLASNGLLWFKSSGSGRVPKGTLALTLKVNLISRVAVYPFAGILARSVRSGLVQYHFFSLLRDLYL